MTAANIDSKSSNRIADAIEAEFPGATPLSRAMTLTLERLIPADPDAWFVQNEGDELAAYVLAGPVIHELRGKRPAAASAQVPPANAARSACSYRVLRVTPDATFSCNVVQTEDEGTPAVIEIEETWQFNLGSGRVIKIVGRPSPPDGHLPFAVALVAAIHARPD